MYGDVRLSIPLNPADKLTILSCRFSVVRDGTGVSTRVAKAPKPNRTKSNFHNELQTSMGRRTRSSHLLYFQQFDGEKRPVSCEMYLPASKPPNPLGLKPTKSGTYRRDGRRQDHFSYLSCLQRLSLEKGIFFSERMDSTYSCPQGAPGTPQPPIKLVEKSGRAKPLTRLESAKEWKNRQKTNPKRTQFCPDLSMKTAPNLAFRPFSDEKSRRRRLKERKREEWLAERIVSRLLPLFIAAMTVRGPHSANPWAPGRWNTSP